MTRAGDIRSPDGEYAGEVKLGGEKESGEVAQRRAFTRGGMPRPPEGTLDGRGMPLGRRVYETKAL